MNSEAEPLDKMSILNCSFNQTVLRISSAGHTWVAPTSIRILWLRRQHLWTKYKCSISPVLQMSSVGQVWVVPHGHHGSTHYFNNWNSIVLQPQWRECVIYFTGRLCVHKSSPARQSSILFPAMLVSRQSSSLCSQLSGRSLGAASGLSQLSRHRWESNPTW